MYYGSGCGCGSYYPPVAGVGHFPGTGFNFPLIVVLFILLIIIGCSCYGNKPC